MDSLTPRSSRAQPIRVLFEQIAQKVRRGAEKAMTGRAGAHSSGNFVKM